MPPIGAHMSLRYNIIGEYASLGIAVLILVFMLFTKPRQTKAFFYLSSATVLAIIANLLQIIIVEISSNAKELYTRNSFTMLLVVFLILYSIILIAVYNYVNQISESTKRVKGFVYAVYIVTMVVYLSGIIYHVYMKSFFYVRTDGIDISHFTRFYCIGGIFCAMVCLIMTIYRRENISRVVRRTTFLVVSLTLIVLILQIIYREAIFSGATYVLPLITGYLLFHSNPYDEGTGCQNINAMESRFITNSRRGKHFYQAFIEFPQLMSNGGSINYQNVNQELARACRKIERISKKVLLYRLNYGTFIAILEVKERSDAENYSEQIKSVLDELYKRSEDHLHYFLGVGGESRRFNNNGNKWTQFFIRYLREKYAVDGMNVYCFAKGEDFSEYDEIYMIEQALADIRTKMDPDDERIVCYAQPIYSVETGSFRSAEALMRLSLEGHMIPPDVFIKIAESSSCIHALTVIMMHKVCKAVEQLAEDHDFDAVTINCSTSDFVDREFYKEIMDIIHSYNIDHKKIRLELTESMMAESYDAVKHNMEMLNMQGIQLYMDDFGTGYSNLERVLDVPVQTIKFDKSLLYKSIQDNRVEEIISYMIEMFKKNGFITLVEGVEDEVQKDYSIEHGFDYIQGYHYAKPMPIENLGKYFDKR